MVTGRGTEERAGANPREVTPGNWQIVPWFITLMRDALDKPNDLDRARDDAATINYSEHPEDACRLVALLMACGLGRPSGNNYAGSTPPEVSLERRVVVRLAKVLSTS